MQSDDKHPGLQARPQKIVEDDDTDKPLVDQEAADIDPKVLKTRVDQVKPGLNSCVTSSLARNPNLHVGKLNVSLTVAPSGVVTDVGYDRNAFSETDLGRCIGRVMKTILLPPFKGEDSERAEFPLALGVGGH